MRLIGVKDCAPDLRYVCEEVSPVGKLVDYLLLFLLLHVRYLFSVYELIENLIVIKVSCGEFLIYFEGKLVLWFNVEDLRELVLISVHL